MPIIQVDEIQEITQSALRAAGATDDEAEIVGDHLVQSSLAGHDSHGIMRALQYAEMIQSGEIIPGTAPTVELDTPVFATMDATNVFGQVVAARAMRSAIQKAKDSSLGLVTIKNSPHNGRLGTFGEIAAAENVVGLVFLNGGGSGQWVAPFGGLGRRLGTNPMAMGAPSGKDFPIVLDISTCIVPEGKIRHYLQNEQEIPAGWMMDGEGKLTTDPGKLYESVSACLQPLGGSLSGHKGFGLSFMNEVLAGALSGCGCARDLPEDHPVRHGLLMLAIDIQQLTTLEEFTSKISTTIDYIKSCPPAPGFEEVLVPGEFEHRNRQDRLANGISISEQIWSDLVTLAGG